MATGVKPRDEESQFTRADLDAIQDALKSKQFRELLADYCEEVRDPANQALYQKEMTQLEKERGYDVTFINPKGGYVIKTSVAGDRKAFINICSNDNIAKPSCSVQEVNGKRGMNWKIPYSIIPPREDFDQKKERCVIYDVVFHSDTMRMAEVNKQFRELVNNTALDGLQKTYNIHFDSNNLRFPKSYYKGMTTSAVIRKEDPDYKPPDEEETSQMDPEVLEKLYPQRTYSEEQKTAINTQNEPKEQKQKPKTNKTEFGHTSDSGYTIPKYIIKQQKNVDFQDFTYAKDCKKYSAIPSHIAVEISLPLLSSTQDCTLDIHEKMLHLISEKPAKYKLDISLPYPVNDQCGNAKFDKSKRKLIVTLPVIQSSSYHEQALKTDSGVEMEDNSSSHSDEDVKDDLVVELSSTIADEPAPAIESKRETKDEFLDLTVGYHLPPYTNNILENTIAFTFHVKNTDPDSMIVQKNGNVVYIKFTSIGAGFVPVYYAAVLVFDDDIKFDNTDGEAWDNNVILQLEFSGRVPEKFQIGLHVSDLKTENFDLSHVKTETKTTDLDSKAPTDQVTAPVVEVTNLGVETNIVVSSNSELDEDDEEESVLTTTEKDEKQIVWTDNGNSEIGAKSILRKPHQSSSESSVDVASSIDYISSDCIHEESSLKKTVRFSDVIAKQFYRYNSSIEGQKKKNQRKKSKKRNQERRKSESEAEDEAFNSPKAPNSRPKSAMKQRRDSGLADTSDAENDCKNTPDSSFLDSINDQETAETKSVLNIIDKNKNIDKTTSAIWEIETKVSKPNQGIVTTENIIHNTELYNPDRLNKGQYLEVAFKNDLIFDLDM